LVIFISIASVTTALYTLSLHDALPICQQVCSQDFRGKTQPLEILPEPREAACGKINRRNMGTRKHQLRRLAPWCGAEIGDLQAADRKSTRLNSSHVKISYAVFCLKKNI